MTTMELVFFRLSFNTSIKISLYNELNNVFFVFNIHLKRSVQVIISTVMTTFFFFIHHCCQYQFQSIRYLSLISCASDSKIVNETSLSINFIYFNESKETKSTQGPERCERRRKMEKNLKAQSTAEQAKAIIWNGKWYNHGNRSQIQ